MGAINFNSLIKSNRLALVNDEEYDFDFNFNYEEVKNKLNNYNFYYFDIKIEAGYYEGFYLKLEEKNTKNIYKNTEEKNEVLKELTQIKKLLIDLVKNNFLNGIYPSWINTNLTTTQTIEEIKNIIKILKNEVIKSYTEKTYKGV